jgi:putative flippase GtrA
MAQAFFNEFNKPATNFKGMLIKHASAAGGAAVMYELLKRGNLIEDLGNAVSVILASQVNLGSVSPTAYFAIAGAAASVISDIVHYALLDHIDFTERQNDSVSWAIQLATAVGSGMVAFQVINPAAIATMGLLAPALALVAGEVLGQTIFVWVQGLV